LTTAIAFASCVSYAGAADPLGTGECDIAELGGGVAGSLEAGPFDAEDVGPKVQPGWEAVGAHAATRRPPPVTAAVRRRSRRVRL